MTLALNKVGINSDLPELAPANQGLTMTNHTFANTDELIAKATADLACAEGRAWCDGKSLEVILEKLPHEYRLWCLRRGYVQFMTHLQRKYMLGDCWSRLIALQPQMSPYAEWYKFDAADYYWALSHQPQIINDCPRRSRQVKAVWAEVLKQYPAFSQYEPQPQSK